MRVPSPADAAEEVIRAPMWDYVKLAGRGLISLCAAIAANHARVLAFQVHAVVVMLVAGASSSGPCAVPTSPAPHGPWAMPTAWCGRA